MEQWTIEGRGVCLKW